LSFKGFGESSLFSKPGMLNLVLGRTLAKNRPVGRVATWTVIRYEVGLISKELVFDKCLGS
jgi:hypothetical protein